MHAFLVHLVDGINEGSQFALIALGYTLVYGIIKLINFAHGEFTMVGAYAGFFAYRSFSAEGIMSWIGSGLQGLPAWEALSWLNRFLNLSPEALELWLRDWSPIFGVPLVVLVGGVAGSGIAVLTERVAYRPLRDSDRLIALLTAIGVSYLLQNLFKFVNNGESMSFRETTMAAHWFQHAFMLGDIPIQTAKLAFLGLTAVLMVGLWWLVMHTRFGRAMRATSLDLEAARLMGIDVDRVIVLTFALGGFFAGITGVLMGGVNYVHFGMGFMPGLIAFVAAVIGGIGSIPGAVLGGFLIGILRSLVQLEPIGATGAYRDIVAFVLLILVLVLRPQGILGKPELQKV